MTRRTIPRRPAPTPKVTPDESEEERWAAYRERYDVIVLPPPYPDEPNTSDRKPIEGSFEIPLAKYPGWRLAFVPKGTIRFIPAKDE